MVISLPGYSRARLPSIWSGCVLAGAPEGGINRKAVLATPNEYSGEVEDVLLVLLEDDTDCGTETETEEEEPNTLGLFGKEDGSVVWQPRMTRKTNNANP